MPIFRKTLLFVACVSIVIVTAMPLRAAGPIAVVKAQYDDVELVLDTYKIPYETITYQELDDEKVYRKYKAIFFPCGIVPSMDQRINVVAQHSRIQSVTLKEEFREIDMKKAAQCIRDFIEEGGAAYFSGYAFEFLQKAYNPFRWFDDFPFMGMPGRIESRLTGDISRFCVKTKMALYMDHTGWISIKSSRGDVIVDGEYETPRGKKSGPVSVLLHRGDGEILYTSYHSTVFSDFRRFNIYRIAGSELLKKTCAMAERWDQKVTGRIVDAVHRGENHRMYYLNLRRGNNTIYFQSERGQYHLDIFDKDFSVIYSTDIAGRTGAIDVVMGDDEYCFVRMYPSSGERFGMFALISASGSRIIPHGKIIIRIIIGFFGLLALFVIKRLFFGKRYEGVFTRGT